jgi:hypothetical protein
MRCGECLIAVNSSHLNCAAYLGLIADVGRLRATAALKLAFEASHAKGTGDLKTLVAELRTACNACHASYLKTQ